MTLNQSPQGQGETILIVDDESVTRMMVRQVLQESGYGVVEADDGDRALELVGQGMPDLIVLDVRMPRMNGFDTCRAVREMPSGQHVPILMLTGLDDVMSVQIAFDAGATDFITKPINWALLAQRLRYALRAREQEARLRESEVRLAHAQKVARLGQWRYDVSSGQVSLSHGMAEHLNFALSFTEFAASAVMQHIYHRDRLSVHRLLRHVHDTGDTGELEFRLVDPEGDFRTVHLYAERVMDDNEQTLQGTVQDVTARIETEARISYFSHYDKLTELPNRILFWDRLTHSIAESKRSGARLAVLLVDLDRFAAINASVGHAKGDRILQLLAHKMGNAIRAGDTLSRTAGDEFAIIYGDIEKESDLGHALARILGCFDKPIQENDLDVYVTASIGIALYPEDGGGLDTLLMHADAAKTMAKQLPGSSYRFYSPAMGKSAKERMAKEAVLRRGIAEDAFVLHYQPFLNLRDGEVWGVEVLIRWRHPEAGLVLPDQFIPLLEEIGMLCEVGEWTVRRACEEMKNRKFMVSVNLSPTQFAQDHLAERLQTILDDTSFPPERLLLEVTEQVFMDDHQRVRNTLVELRRRGIKVAMDDFGTGFSSLSYLQLYTPDFLKIDRSFIGKIDDESSSMSIVRSTIDLGHNLGMRVIGEGVEKTTVLESLTRMDCDLVQGFLIARPADLEELNKWLSAR